MKFFKIIFLLFIFFFGKISSQTLDRILYSKKDLTAKISDLNAAFERYKLSSIDSAILCIASADSLAILTANDSIRNETLGMLAIVMAVKNPGQGIELGYKNLELAKQSGKCYLIANAYNILTRINSFVGTKEKQLEFYLLAEKEAKLCGRKALLLMIYEVGQGIYIGQNNFIEAKKLLFKRVELDPHYKSTCGFNQDMGQLYTELHIPDTATFYYKKSIVIAEKEKDTLNLCRSLSDFSTLLISISKTKESIECLKRVIELSHSSNNQRSFLEANYWLAKNYFAEKDFENAKKAQEINLKADIARDFKMGMMNNYGFLARINHAMKDHSAAYENLKRSFDLYVVINSAEISNKLQQTEEDHLKKEKQKEIDFANKQKDVETKVKNFSLLALAVSVLFIIVIIFALINIIRSRKIIAAQKAEVEEQKKHVDEKQLEILDSIRYARRIQSALLPSEKKIDKALKKTKL